MQGIFIHSKCFYFPLSFLPILGRKHFDGSEEKTLICPPIPPPPPSPLSPTKYPPKMFSLPFSLFLFYFIFLFSLKNPLHQTYPKGHLGKNLSLTSYKGFQTQLSHIPPITRKLAQVFTFFPLFSFVKIYLFLLY